MLPLYAPEVDQALDYATFLSSSASRYNEAEATVLGKTRTGSAMIADRRTSRPSRPWGSAVSLVGTTPMAWSE
jgi:hypothetical protein